MTAVAAPPAGATADVALALFSASWSDIDRRGFPEDRLAIALNGHPDVRRLLIVDPLRSVLGRVPAMLRGSTEPPIAIRPGGAVRTPLRLRRSDPVAPDRMVRRHESGMRRAAERLGMERPAVITTHPLIAGFGEFSWARSVTYYAWDDWLASVPHERWWPAYDEAHRRLRETGRRVVAVSDAALKSVAPTGPHAVISNGVEPSEWLELGPAPDWFTAKPGPRMLYIGSLDSRVDLAQARAVATAYPQGSLTFVGPMLDAAHFEALRDLPNVDVRPGLPRTAVPGLVAAADVCVIPHVRNDLTEAMSPLKLYEYLAAGRPVAAVDLPPIRAVDGRVALAPTGGDFVPAVERALALGPAGEAERLAFVAANGWSSRFDELLSLALEDA
jgi:glycosyltransferase involved in cell wall biosynthesis